VRDVAESRSGGSRVRQAVEEVAIPFVSEEDPRQRNTRLQMVGVLAVGALLGYLAASGKLNPFATASSHSR